MALSAEAEVRHFLRKDGNDKQLSSKCAFLLFINFFKLLLTFLVIYFLSLITCQLYVIEDCPNLL